MLKSGDDCPMVKTSMPNENNDYSRQNKIIVISVIVFVLFGCASRFFWMESIINYRKGALAIDTCALLFTIISYFCLSLGMC